MISIRYSDLVKMGACTDGKRRFIKGRIFKARFLNAPVTLQEIQEGHNSSSDILWFASQVAGALTPEQSEKLARAYWKYLDSKGLTLLPVTSENAEIRRFTMLLQEVVYHRTHYLSRRKSLVWPLIVGNRYFLGGHFVDHYEELLNILKGLDIELDWSKGYIKL